MAVLEFFEEDVTFAGPPVPATWWTGYRSVLEKEGFGAASIDVIDVDSSFIVDRGVLGAEAGGTEDWPEGGVRTGVVVGAVQSGKTASMMAVAARALDAEVDVLVVLAGTRTSLWLQTFDRFGAQLDTWTAKHNHRVLRPNISVPAPDEVPSVPGLYTMQKAAVRKALSKGRPIVVIAMKQVDHLERLGAALRDVVYPVASEMGRKIHLVVIDDEADDASVADPLSPIPGVQAKQVPLRVVELWGDRKSPWKTVGDHVRAIYVAYTATPQANFLQDPSNPLAPRDFAVALRTPGPEGDLVPRSGTFHETGGLHSWYCGGELFYRTLVDEPLCVVTDAEESGEGDTDTSLFDSVRAYLVATAVRLARASGRVGPATARTMTFADRGEARAVPMKPASMLVHPSSTKGEQFAIAEKIHAWSAGVQAVSDGDVHGRLVLGVEGIRNDMRANRDLWRRWLESYRASSLELGEAFGADAVHHVADDLDVILALVLEEIVPGTFISVVNSDAAADDRPKFVPVESADGWQAAPNLSTIFVAGNVMSRGLTLEGLTTTYFSRVSDQPSADTQMQMQRWFGFRGEFLELCRVFLRGDQLDLFATYHEHDEALRRDIIARMDEPEGWNLAVTILQGLNHVATAKVSHVSKGVLSPGVKPFLRLLNTPADDVHNQTIVKEFFDREKEDLVLDERAALLRWTYSAMELADILDALEFAAHRPARHGAAAAMWLSMENHVGAAGEDAYPLYRAAGREADEGIPLGVYSPSYLAAYLRLWSASAGRQVPGLMTTDLNAPYWNLSPSGQPGAEAPRFSLALRFGSGDVVRSGPLAELPFPVRAMNRAVVGTGLQSEWGSRGLKNGVALGDEVLDIALRALPNPDGYRERTRADGGMLLIHPIAREGGVALAFGLALPPGGPDHVRAEKQSNDS